MQLYRQYRYYRSSANRRARGRGDPSPIYNGGKDMKKKPLEMVKKSFVGLPYSLMVAHQIESCGYGFVVSCETGMISDVFEPGCLQE